MSYPKVYTRSLFTDKRGLFSTLAPLEEFKDFVQTNYSVSHPKVLRGLHYQPGMAKLVTCLQGTILDVAVDLKTGNYELVELSEENGKAFLVPDGYAHGFLVTSKEPAVVLYHATTLYDKTTEGGVNAYDKTLNIPWPIKKKDAILSDRDKLLDDFNEVTSRQS